MLEEAFQPPTATPGWGGPTPTAAQRILFALQRFTADRLGARRRDLLQELDGLDQLIAHAGALGSPEFKLFAWRAVSGANPPPTVGAPWDDAFMRQIDLVASLRAARAALAIERLLNLPGMQLPTDLEQLAPRFLRQVPIDPYANAPLRYQRQESGYVIYSVGPDLKDDGAAERTSSSRVQQPGVGHDLVFRVQRGVSR
jgi:hypothetical protein